MKSSGGHFAAALCCGLGCLLCVVIVFNLPTISLIQHRGPGVETFNTTEEIWSGLIRAVKIGSGVVAFFLFVSFVVLFTRGLENDNQEKRNNERATILGTRIQPKSGHSRNRYVAFVLIPFNEKFKNIYEVGIKQTLLDLGMDCERVDEMEFNGGILEQIQASIQWADVIIADLTDRNPNVFYEVGYAHACGKRTIHLAQNAANLPFDIRHLHCIIYDKTDLMTLRWKLQKRVSAMLDAMASAD